MPECVVCGGCTTFDLNALATPGEGLVCNSVVVIKEQVDLTAEGLGAFHVEEKLPFELMIIRKVAVA